MDYGKFKYEAAQKAKEARRNQANTILKEVRFRLKIDKHDYETKRKRAEGFLKAGDKVKAMILFRGREQSRPEQGVRLLQRFAEDVAEFGTVESTPTIDGRNMVMVIGPLKNKSEAKAEANAQRAASKARAHAPAEEPVAAADDSAQSDESSPRPGDERGEVMPKQKTHSGCQEALQDHRQRQGHEAAGRHAPQPRGQVQPAASAASTRTRSSLRGRRQGHQEAARQVTPDRRNRK